MDTHSESKQNKEEQNQNESAHKLAVKLTNKLFTNLELVTTNGNIDKKKFMYELNKKLLWDEKQIEKIFNEIDTENNNTVNRESIYNYLLNNQQLANDIESTLNKVKNVQSSNLLGRHNYSVHNLQNISPYYNTQIESYDGHSYFINPQHQQLVQHQQEQQQFLQSVYQNNPYNYPRGFNPYNIPIASGNGGGTINASVFNHGIQYLRQQTSEPKIQISNISSSKQHLGNNSTTIDNESDEKSTSLNDDTSDKFLFDNDITEFDNESLTFEDWVKYNHGRVIKKVLIANNGISSVKCIRCIRKWCHEMFNDMDAIHFVCMATPEDINSNAEFIRMANEIIKVPGGSNNYNYANVPLIVNIAKQTKCDAVWPGWGHASENPLLPKSLVENNIIWIGPTSLSMYQSGDKILSTLIAQSVNVPCIPWSGSKLKLKSIRKHKKINNNELNELFKKSCINNENEALICAKNIGFPVMIKASEGGGGKGIRLCKYEKDVKKLYNLVKNEVPGSPIFIMKLAHNARHLEVQLLGDKNNNVIAIYSRDCSIQRRHQKIIEEGPIVNVDEKIILEIEKSAVRLAKAFKYECAGTVEFLYDTINKTYCFLELNPRLQVEHPVSELISDLNLPALQLIVSMGIPLYCIKSIRKLYNQDLKNTNKFSLIPENRIKPIGHAIACRITAENPLNNFTPTSGIINELNFKSLPNVWGYFSLKTNGKIHEYADSQFGHIFSHGKDREEARKNMILALNDLEIRGEIRTTVEYLKSILQNNEYKSGNIHTLWLEEKLNNKDITIKLKNYLNPQKIVCLGAISKAHKIFSKLNESLFDDLSNGRNITRVNYQEKLNNTLIDLIYKNVKYEILVSKTGKDTYCLRQIKDINLFKDIILNNNKNNNINLNKNNIIIWRCDCIVNNLSDNGMLIEIDNNTHTVYANINKSEQLVMNIDGHLIEFEQEYDPSNVKATLPGKLVRLLVPNNSHIEKGTEFAEIEVMKMYMPLVAQESGIIRFNVTPGTILQIGKTIANLELDDPSQIKTAKLNTDKFVEYKEPFAPPVKIDRRFEFGIKKLENMLDGYISNSDIDSSYIKEKLDEVMNTLRNPKLSVHAYFTVLEPLKSRLDGKLYKQLEKIGNDFIKNVPEHQFVWESRKLFPKNKILNILNRYKESLDIQENKNIFDILVQPIKNIVNKYSKGTHLITVEVISSLLEKFYNSEKYFVHSNETIVIQELRRIFDDEKVSKIIRLHFHLKHSEHLIILLLDIVDKIFNNTNVNQDFTKPLTNILETMIATLTGHPYTRIHLKCREIFLIESLPTSLKYKLNKIEEELRNKNILSANDILDDNVTNNFDTPKLQSISSFNSPRTGNQLSSIRRPIVSIVNDSKSKGRLLYEILEILPRFMLTDDKIVSINAVKRWITNVFSAPLYRLNKMSLKVEYNGESTTSTFNFSIGNENNNNTNNINNMLKNDSRYGFFGFFSNLNTLQKYFKDIILKFPSNNSFPLNLIILGFKHSNIKLNDSNENRLVTKIEQFITSFDKLLREKGIGFISILITNDHKNLDDSNNNNDPPLLFTFREALEYKEDRITRNILPQLVQILEMNRLHGFRINWMQNENRKVHIFEASQDGNKNRRLNEKRLFVRVPVNQIHDPSVLIEDVLTNNFTRFGSVEVSLVEAIHELESVITSKSINTNNNTINYNSYKFNHILLSCFFDVDFSSINDNNKNIIINGNKFNWKNKNERKKWIYKCFKYCKQRMTYNYNEFEKSLKRLHVTTIEVRIEIRTLRNEITEPFIFRIVLDDPGNGITQIHNYIEKVNKNNRNQKILISLDKNKGPLHNCNPNKPHSEVTTKLMSKRRIAISLNTTYVYDWIALFKNELNNMWNKYNEKEKQRRVKLNKYKSNSLVRSSIEMDLNDNNINNTLTTNSLLESKSLLNLSFNSPKYSENEQEIIELNSNDSSENETPKVNKLNSIEEDNNENNINGYVSDNELLVNDEKQQKQKQLLIYSELILNENGKLVETKREPGKNTIGMVSWKMNMKTPECPNGRNIYVVANDITTRLGTFGIPEDKLYDAVCSKATKEGLPFIYLSANSGARIGLAEMIRNKFKIGWKINDKYDYEYESDDSDNDDIKNNSMDNLIPTPKTKSKAKQYDPVYIYLTENDYKQVKQYVRVEKIKAKNEIRYKILDIYGESGIGVENLSGSGLVAGSTSKAYRNTFTLSYVSGRSVGIGAYLVRLGQRIIQRNDSPILLTGYQALNNLLGKEVYVSNLQIGGSDEVMMPNGVTHKQVDNDIQGAHEILRWLSFVPPSRNKSFNITPINKLYDSIDRNISYYPLTPKEDPRKIIGGYLIDNNIKNNKILNSINNNNLNYNKKSKVKWLSGLFDRDSFVEYLPNWAKTVVVGRARLGNIPVGIIASEPRTQSCIKPPDPASKTSREISFQQAGQVWYPDSSYKTSQAICDFNNEDLPLFILANWRGFSGGQRDMFNEILKYGSYIVDYLSVYKQPIFIYLAPYCELRGGAWVVLDSLINNKCIEMYGDNNSKANVLEPTGTIGLKYKKRHLLSTMRRLDTELILLNKKLQKTKLNNMSDNLTVNSLQNNDLRLIKSKIVLREQALLPNYQKVSLLFAELHDTPHRMKKMGVIKDIISFKSSRRFFYWRLRYKLIELNSIKRILKILNLNENKWNDGKQLFNEWCNNNILNKTDNNENKSLENEEDIKENNNNNNSSDDLLTDEDFKDDNQVSLPRQNTRTHVPKNDKSLKDKSFVLSFNNKLDLFNKYLEQLNNNNKKNENETKNSLINTVNKLKKEVEDKDNEIKRLKLLLEQKEKQSSNKE